MIRLWGHCTRSPLSAKWTGTGEHYAVREDRLWNSVNFRFRHPGAPHSFS
jgi:hypothetical protein